jgi:hypothetical protein
MDNRPSWWFTRSLRGPLNSILGQKKRSYLYRKPLPVLSRMLPLKWDNVEVWCFGSAGRAVGLAGYISKEYSRRGHIHRRERVIRTRIADRSSFCSLLIEPVLVRINIHALIMKVPVIISALILPSSSTGGLNLEKKHPPLPGHRITMTIRSGGPRWTILYPTAVPVDPTGSRKTIKTPNPT